MILGFQINWKSVLESETKGNHQIYKLLSMIITRGQIVSSTELFTAILCCCELLGDCLVQITVYTSNSVIFPLVVYKLLSSFSVFLSFHDACPHPLSPSRLRIWNDSCFSSTCTLLLTINNTDILHHCLTNLSTTLCRSTNCSKTQFADHLNLSYKGKIKYNTREHKRHDIN